jgi:hypothetical protein
MQSAPRSDVDGEPDAEVVPPLWSAPLGFITPMTPTTVDAETQPQGDVLVSNAQPLGSLRSMRLCPIDPQRTSIPNSAKSASNTSPNDENSTEIDGGSEAEFVTDVSYVSALDIFYTFLSHLTQKQLQVVCSQVELPKCGTKGRLTRNILRKVNSVLNKQILGRCAHGQLQEKATRDCEITEIAARVDVDCKISSGASRKEYIKATFKDFSKYCLSRSDSGPVIRVRKCMESNIETALDHDAVGASRGWSTGDFGRLVSVIKDERVSQFLVASGLRLNRRQLDAKHDADHVWSDQILPLFRDTRFKPFIVVPIRMLQKFKDPDLLDFTKLPEREVTAAQLRKWFYDVRGEFSKCYSRWSRSGQNDPENFQEFAPICPDGHLSAVGERCCILAAAFQI